MVALEELLRDNRLAVGHIQLLRNAHGWQASVWHYAPPGEHNKTDVFDDPVEALRKALLEDERLTRDVERRYAEAPKSTRRPRVLMWHAESDSLFEGEEFDPGDGLVENVTGHAFYEAHFAAGTVPVSDAPAQLDIEDAIAAAAPTIDFEDILG